MRIIVIAIVVASAAPATAGGPPFMGGVMPSSIQQTRSPDPEDDMTAARMPSFGYAFDAIDVDHDGSISRMEFATAHRHPVHPRRSAASSAGGRR